MLRGSGGRGLACFFPAPWSRGSHHHDDDDDDDDETEHEQQEQGRVSIMAAGSSSCLVRWTLRGRALRKKPAQVRHMRPRRSRTGRWYEN